MNLIVVIMFLTPVKIIAPTVHQAHTVAQITMKTLINRSVLDVGQVCAKMDRKSPNTARC